MDNLEILETRRRKTKQKHNTICVGYQYMQNIMFWIVFMKKKKDNLRGIKRGWFITDKTANSANSEIKNHLVEPLEKTYNFTSN